jgi:hypothetical protein
MDNNSRKNTTGDCTCGIGGIMVAEAGLGGENEGEESVSACSTAVADRTVTPAKM